MPGLLSLLLFAAFFYLMALAVARRSTVMQVMGGMGDTGRGSRRGLRQGLSRPPVQVLQQEVP